MQDEEALREAYIQRGPRSERKTNDICYHMLRILKVILVACIIHYTIFSIFSPGCRGRSSIIEVSLLGEKKLEKIMPSVCWLLCDVVHVGYRVLCRKKCANCGLT